MSRCRPSDRPRPLRAVIGQCGGLCPYPPYVLELRLGSAGSSRPPRPRPAGVPCCGPPSSTLRSDTGRSCAPSMSSTGRHWSTHAHIMIFDDVRDVCSPADANLGQPVPTRVTAAARGRKRWFVCSSCGRLSPSLVSEFPLDFDFRSLNQPLTYGADLTAAMIPPVATTPASRGSRGAAGLAGYRAQIAPWSLRRLPPCRRRRRSTGRTARRTGARCAVAVRRMLEESASL